MATMTVTQARARLPELLDLVLDGEEVTITRHGKPAAVLVRWDSLRIRRADDAFRQAAELGEMIAEARKRPLGMGPGISAERAEQLVAELYAEREQGR